MRGAMTPAQMREAEAHLCRHDTIMAGLIGRHGPCNLADSPYEPFHALTTAIVGQQLSARAAQTIGQRIAQLAPAPFQPGDILRVSGEQLRAAGLSVRKAACLHDLARRIADGRLAFAALAGCDDETVIAALTGISGIGGWTAEMFLIFGLKRPDVLAPGDAGLRRAVRQLYGDGRTLAHVAPPWRPYASVASWYLWRHIG